MSLKVYDRVVCWACRSHGGKSNKMWFYESWFIFRTYFAMKLYDLLTMFSSKKRNFFLFISLRVNKEPTPRFPYLNQNYSLHLIDLLTFIVMKKFFCNKTIFCKKYGFHDLIIIFHCFWWKIITHHQLLQRAFKFFFTLSSFFTLALRFQSIPLF